MLLRAAVIAGALLAALPTVASAAVVRVDGAEVHYIADPGEVNDIQVSTSGSDTFVSHNAFLMTGSGCYPESETFVRCVTPGPASRFVGDLGDGADAFQFFPGGTTTASVDGGDGRDDLRGWGGNDELIGGSGNDVLFGEYGDDSIKGGAGDDVLRSSGGDDAFDGGADTDEVTYASTLAGVEVDLSAGTAGSDGTPHGVRPGTGVDSLAGVEAVTASSHGDTLIGSSGSDRLAGGGGHDLVEGLGGDDALDGGGGTDTVSYDTPAGVDVDLGAETAASDGYGDGDSTLKGFEVLSGSEFADVLTGSDQIDEIHALGGNDVVRTRDAVADVVACGDGAADTAHVDFADSPITECETVDDPAPPAPPAITGSDPGSGSNQNFPRIRGTAPAGSTVSLYSTADCTGAPLAVGAAAAFASGGLQISVPDNSTTILRAAVETADIDSPSGCSAPYTYRESTPAPPPSSAFELGPLKRNLRNGTAKLGVSLPGPGDLRLRGRAVKPVRRTVPAAGKTRLPIEARRKPARKLRTQGRAKLRLKVTFTPTGGESSSRTRKVKLKLRRRAPGMSLGQGESR